MYLNYAKVESRCGEPPVLRLQTLSGKTLGAIPYVHNLKFEINYSELSTIEFDIPYMVDGKVNPMYRSVESYKVIYTDDLGIYILMSPSLSGDGIKEIKSCRGYSLESQFEKKRLFLAGGTYDFWNPAHPDKTVLGILLSLDPDWKPGYIDPKLIGCYRTFDEYSDNALGFMYGSAMEKYNCVIVVDVYEKTVSAYHTSTDRGSLPIYLDYNNLVETTKVEELTDDMVTKLYPYGADNLSILDANPIGTEYMIDLSYFLSNGDLDVAVSDGALLSDRFRAWQEDVVGIQDTYFRLGIMRDTKTALRLTADAELVDLQAELDTLYQEQSALIKALSEEKEGTDSYKEFESQLAAKNIEIEAKKVDIQNKITERDAIQAEHDSYQTQINALCEPVLFENYFTEDEQRILGRFLIEGDVTNETFVATSVDADFNSVSASVSGAVVISSTTYKQVDPVNEGDPSFLEVKSGGVSIESIAFSAEMVSGILQMDGTDMVMSAQVSAVKYGESEFEGGLLTLVGTFDAVDIATVDGLYDISFTPTDAKFYATSDAGEYKSRSVTKELYNYGAEVMNECAWPTMEFSLDTANFLFLEEFAPFKDKLELGCGIHMNLGSEGLITANIIGLTLDYESEDALSLTFSNQYQRKNGVKTLRDMIVGASMSGRSFDAGKFTYNQSANKTNQVAQILNDNFEAAKNKVLCADDVFVSIQGSGIHIGDGDEQIRIVNGMIAMTDDNWNSVKTAIGKFVTPLGTHWGVNAELIAGNLLIGQNMVIENENNLFKLDESGAWLYNSQILFQRTDSEGNAKGQLMIHPDYGIVAGTGGIYTTDGASVTPGFIDPETGEMVLDSQGMPDKSNFFLDLRDGNAYFRGNVYANDGVFNGTIYARAGEFSGALKAATIEGDLVGSNGWLVGCGIKVGENAAAANGYNFYVDPDGNLVINGDINLSGGTITWGNNKPESGISAGQAYTIIDSCLVSSPLIQGAQIESVLNEDSSTSGEINMYYLNIGDPNYLAGTIRLDDDGNTGDDEAVEHNRKYRMFIQTNEVDALGEPFQLKMESAGGMSMESKDNIYMYAPNVIRLRADSGVTDDPVNGRVSITASGKLILVGHPVVAEGEWDFSNASVTGLNCVFA